MRWSVVTWSAARGDDGSPLWFVIFADGAYHYWCTV
jgi:hypothetical protein